METKTKKCTASTTLMASQQDFSSTKLVLGLITATEATGILSTYSPFSLRLWRRRWLGMQYWEERRWYLLSKRVSFRDF